MERHTMFSDWNNQYCENYYDIQSNLQIQCNPHQIVNGNFYRIIEKNLQFLWKHQRPQTAKTIFRKKYGARGIRFSDFRKSSVFNKWCWEIWTATCKRRKLEHFLASLVAQLIKNQPAMRETWVLSLGWEDVLEKGKATHSSILAWRIPWTVQFHRVAKSQTRQGTFTFTPSTKINRNWVKDLNARSDIIKPSEERIRSCSDFTFRLV